MGDSIQMNNKYIVSLLAAGILLLSLAGCGENKEVVATKNAIDSIGEVQYWANELELTGTAAYYLLNEKVDGIIALSAFGCGPDSLMVDEIAYHCKEAGMPLIHLTIDEHTGEAGFITRLEAFTDMLLRKKRNILTKKSEKSKEYIQNKNIVEIKKEKILTSSIK